MIKRVDGLVDDSLDQSYRDDLSSADLFSCSLIIIAPDLRPHELTKGGIGDADPPLLMTPPGIFNLHSFFSYVRPVRLSDRL
jgi:hypothetical protein